MELKFTQHDRSSTCTRCFLHQQTIVNIHVVIGYFKGTQSSLFLDIARTALMQHTPVGSIVRCLQLPCSRIFVCIITHANRISPDLGWLGSLVLYPCLTLERKLSIGAGIVIGQHLQIGMISPIGCRELTAILGDVVIKRSA